MQIEITCIKYNLVEKMAWSCSQNRNEDNQKVQQIIQSVEDSNGSVLVRGNEKCGKQADMQVYGYPQTHTI